MSQDQQRYRLVGGGTYYRGAVLSNIDPKQLRHMLSLGMVEPVPQPTAEAVGLSVVPDPADSEAA